MENSRLKVMLEREIKDDKKKWKKKRDSEKQLASLAILNCSKEKKNIGEEMRESKISHRKRINS